MPAPGKYESNASMYSCVAPGPPCSSSTFIVGLFPVRLVHTLNVPFGVLIGIIFTPPASTSSRPELSRYADDAAGVAARLEQPDTITATHTTQDACFIEVSRI